MTRKERWSLHLATWSECELCDLSKTRNSVVLGEGKLPCDILVLGTAPGLEDDIVGEPFYGREGNWLRNRLTNEIPGQYKIYFDHLLACRWFEADSGKKKRDIDKHIECCKPRVVNLIEIAQPRVILCLGTVVSGWFKKKTTGCISVPKKILVVHAAHLYQITRAKPPQQAYLEATFDLQLRQIVGVLEDSDAKDHS